jgi:hypothetical protein
VKAYMRRSKEPPLLAHVSQALTATTSKERRRVAGRAGFRVRAGRGRSAAELELVPEGGEVVVLLGPGEDLEGPVRVLTPAGTVGWGDPRTEAGDAVLVKGGAVDDEVDAAICALRSTLGGEARGARGEQREGPAGRPLPGRPEEEEPQTPAPAPARPARKRAGSKLMQRNPPPTESQLASFDTLSSGVPLSSPAKKSIRSPERAKASTGLLREMLGEGRAYTRAHLHYTTAPSDAGTRR